jgi:hypothetical protein
MDPPYAEEKFKPHFRHNSFFIGGNPREKVSGEIAQRIGKYAARIVEWDLKLKGELMRECMS